MRAFLPLMFLGVASLSIFAVDPTFAQNAAPLPSPSPAAQTQPATKPAPQSPAIPKKVDPLQAIFDELAMLREQVTQLRSQLASQTLRADSCQREVEELRQYIADHQQFGDDFSKYQAVKAEAEKEARRKELEAAKQQREQERAERAAKMQAARAQKAQQNAANSKIQKYRRMGFSPLGLDVFVSKMAFSYESKDGQQQTRIDYDPLIGTYLRPIRTAPDTDYSKMTISGSVLNASDEIRNLGVAVTFFDDNGNQVGHEIVQINNARPDVPYPFTSKIEMALNRQFDSSSTYVLYADVVED
jgi:hypothetical protein